MKATEWAVLVSASASSVAAVASVAVWWRGRSDAEWEVQSTAGSMARSRVVNIGGRTARDVHVRVGLPSAPENQLDTAQAPTLAKGEGLLVRVAPGIDQADFAVVVTWRGRFRRRKTWTHIVV